MLTKNLRGEGSTLSATTFRIAKEIGKWDGFWGQVTRRRHSLYRRSNGHYQSRHGGSQHLNPATENYLRRDGDGVTMVPNVLGRLAPVYTSEPDPRHHLLL